MNHRDPTLDPEPDRDAPVRHPSPARPESPVGRTLAFFGADELPEPAATGAFVGISAVGAALFGVIAGLRAGFTWWLLPYAAATGIGLGLGVCWLWGRLR